MRLGEKIPVPQLPASQAARVQRRVLSAVGSPAEPRRRPWRLALAGVGLAAVAAALVWGAPRAIESRGAVSGGLNVVVTELASAGDAVTVQLGDATVTLGPESRASLIQSRGAVEVALERGRVECEVEPIAGRAPFFVGAAGVSVEVVGTVFSVDRTGGLRVEVERGKVRVHAPSGPVVVEAGKAWTEADGVVSVVAEADLEPELTVDDEPGGDREPRAETETAGERRRDRSSPRRPRKKSRSKKRARDRRERINRPPRHRRPRGDPALREAMELEDRDPRAAIRAYTDIASERRGRTASYALYSKAYVEYFKLGDRGAALDTLDLFKRRFPRAREAQSAQWLRVLALCDVGRIGECRAAAYSYIRRFPEGQFVDAASRVVNR